MKKVMLIIMLLTFVFVVATTRDDVQYNTVTGTSSDSYTKVMTIKSAGYDEKTILIKNTSTAANSINVKVVAVAYHNGQITEELQDELGNHVVALLQGETYLLYVTRAWAELYVYYASTTDTETTQCSVEAVLND